MRRGRRIGVGAVLAAGLLTPTVLVLGGSPLATAATSCPASNTTVTTNADTGAGSLRTALTNATLNAGPQTICIDTTLVMAEEQRG